MNPKWCAVWGIIQAVPFSALVVQVKMRIEKSLYSFVQGKKST
jgi:hypothetical protein